MKRTALGLLAVWCLYGAWTVRTWPTSTEGVGYALGTGLLALVGVYLAVRAVRMPAD
jgi:hypothetical protein